jgi:hypothetical protein
VNERPVTITSNDAKGSSARADFRSFDILLVSGRFVVGPRLAALRQP